MMHLNVNYQHLRSFHAVASEGSFVKAARRLNVSQPTLSQQIKALENRHGSNLFEGRKHPLELSRLGRQLFSHTQRLFATSRDIEDLLGKPGDAPNVPVRIVADSPIYAARLVQALLETDPETEYDVHIANFSEATQRLREAHADVAIISDPQIDPSFVYLPLFKDCLQVVMPASHPLADAPSFPLEALACETLLLREVQSKTRAATLSALRQAEIVPARQMSLNSREAIREAVALGMGLSLFFSLECPPDSRLRAVPPDHQPDSALLTGYLAFRADHRRSGTIRRVIACVERLRRLSPLPF